MMMQPAMVVLDSSGEALPQLTWSWKTMGFTASDDSAMLPQFGSIIAYRPDASDLAAAIEQRRPAKMVDLSEALGWPTASSK